MKIHALWAGALVAPRRVQSSNSLHTIVPGPPASPSDASINLSPGLASFSIETAFFETFFGNLSQPNQLSLDVLNLLANRSGHPAEIRIGGITADSTTYDANQDVGLFNFFDGEGALINTTLGPSFWRTLGLLPEGTKFLFTLNLGQYNYNSAAETAQAAYNHIGSSLIAFELGNEPDHYSPSLTPEAYTNYFRNWSAALTEAYGLPKPFFQLGATADDPIYPPDSPSALAQLNCASAIRAGALDAGTAFSCSEHTYQYSVCDPARAAIATLDNLVNHTRIAQYLDLWQPQISISRERIGGDFVIGEFSSVSCSGKDGVSNTFGQALWLLDTALYAASINVSRVYAHQGGPLALQSSTQLNHGGLSFYDMWWPVDNANGPAQVFPSLAAYVMLNDALGPNASSSKIAYLYPGRQANGSSATDAEGGDDDGTLAVYGFWDVQGPYGAAKPDRAVVVSAEVYNSTSGYPRPVRTVDLSAYAPGVVTVRLWRLTAPGAELTTSAATTYAGQSYATGKAVGALEEERANVSAVLVRASEAVLIWL